MKTTMTWAAALLVGAIACDRTPTTSETTTTSAKQDLDHAADKTEEKVKAAASAVKQEAKEEWKNLDVKVESGRDAGLHIDKH